MRIKCTIGTVPPVVAEARSTIHKKELLKAVEKSRSQMYNFLDKPVSREQKRALYSAELDEFDEVMRENRVCMQCSCSNSIIVVVLF